MPRDSRYDLSVLKNPSTAGRRHSVAMSPFHHAASRQVYR
jgi:hypothetical protein